MKIIHRLAFRASSSQRQELESLGVRVPSGVAMPGGDSPFAAFDVVEDENWTKVRALLETWQVSEGVVRTEFSKDEIGAADWLELGAWHHGYPQPDEASFGFRQVTYDLADWCERCGIGKKQKAPFQMIGEPKWGRNGVMQLTWIYDELFATPRVWAGVFEPAGIGRRPVMDTRGHELTTVVQLAIADEVALATTNLAYERCSSCGRVKYAPVTRGPSPGLTELPPRAMAKTREYFGSGGQADKRIIVSQQLARALAASGVRGATLRPVAPG